MYCFYKSKNKKLIWWLAALFWCSFIFANSQISSDGSGKISGSIVILINNFLQNILGQNFYITNFAVRKSAHFSEYFILGLLFHKCFSKTDSWTYSFLYPVIAGVIYAISDEVHQYFVPGRAMTIVDVLIDTAGVILAVSAFKYVNERRNHKKSIDIVR